MATSSSATRYPFLLTNPTYEDMTDFIGNTLNTPDIVDILDSFHPPFQSCSEKDFNANSMFNDESSIYGMMDAGGNQSVMTCTTSNYSSYTNSPSSNHQHQTNSTNYYERKSYSPLLESAEINLENMSSPEMAPVSPNKVCPQSDYNYQYDNSTGAYQILETALPIKSEYDQVSSLVEFLNDQSQSADNIVTLRATQPTTNSSFYGQQQSSPHSPASISSNYSLETCGNQQKTFTTLDNIPCSNIKQEPIESMVQYQAVVPTVVDETIVSAAFVPNNICPSSNTNQVIYNLSASSSTNVNVPSTTNYYMTTNPNPTTMQMAAMATTAANTGHGRKRTATTSFGWQNTSSGQKKQRISKREKQKMMEMYIERYERENKELSNQIELFEKQINYCKKYLNENVAPYIQKQQQQQNPIHQTLQSFVSLA